MRVAVVHQNYMLYGGGERFSALLARELDARVHTVAVNPDVVATHPDLREYLVDHSRRSVDRAWFLEMLRDHFAADVDADFIIYSGDIPVYRVLKDRTPYLHYSHTPPRYLWGGDLRREETLKHHGFSRVRYLAFITALTLASRFLHGHVVPGSRVAVNSHLVHERYRHAYGVRPARVIHPPIDFGRYHTGPFDDGFLTVSRLEPAKRIDVLIRACAANDERLTVVGDGPDRARLERVADDARADVTFEGAVSDQRLGDLYSRCRAFLFAALNEDFGLVPFEALASGKPVVGVAEGGYWERLTADTSWAWRDEAELTALLPRITRAACEARETACRDVARTLDAPRVAADVCDMIHALTGRDVEKERAPARRIRPEGLA